MSEAIDRGILGSVPGQFLAPNRHGLPDAETATVDRVTSTIDAGWAGVVRVTFERTKFRHHRSFHWGWHAIHAERVEQQP